MASDKVAHQLLLKGFQFKIRYLLMQPSLHQELKSQKFSYMPSMFPFSLCTCFPAIPLILRYSYLTERNKTIIKYSNHCWTKSCLTVALTVKY